jgi:hypothetical protein
MQYEQSIICLACGCTKSQGGLSGPVQLTNDQVLVQAEHNPGCPIPQIDVRKIAINSEVDAGENATVTRYTIALGE